ncbi:hypothetical protein IW245_005536 [Longispora fulva]|uniref:DUF5753 domain-containing protein n=1 Tax=Longispora fulva TaxID=619741 RepID=A0A8J7GLV9_9ACTN|nr:hypothetical protein [Longispora fulva]
MTATDGPTFHLIIDEVVLRRPVGGDRIMRAQLRRMVELAELPSITLQVFPIDAVTPPSPGGAFSVLRFKDDLDVGVVAVPNHLSSVYFDEPCDVEAYVEMFGRLAQHALDPDDSVKLVARLGNA